MHVAMRFHKSTTCIVTHLDRSTTCLMPALTSSVAITFLVHLSHGTEFTSSVAIRYFAGPDGAQGKRVCVWGISLEDAKETGVGGLVREVCRFETLSLNVIFNYDVAQNAGRRSP